MPWKSRAQMRKFYALNREGKISDSVLKEWKDATPNIKALPEKLAFTSALYKIAFEGNLPEQAEQQVNASDFTSCVKGSNLQKDTGQARSGYALKNRTGDSKVYPQSMRHRWRTSRG